MVAFLLLVVGGINWGLVGVASFDLVWWLFGEMLGFSIVADIVYILVGVAAIYELIIHKSVCTDCGAAAPMARQSMDAGTEQM